MQQIDHRVIKFSVGIIAISMAFFMQLASGEPLKSISESYHYRARDWFVGLLFAIAGLVFSFKGQGRFERRLTILAGLSLVIVAVAPCECQRSKNILSPLHFPAAAIVFSILAYFCWRFKKTANTKFETYPESRRRVQIYTMCLYGMIGCIGMAAFYVAARLAKQPIDEKFPDYIFWLETLGLVSFGVSWLAASRTLPVITNIKERYRFIDGSAPEDSPRSPKTLNNENQSETH
jgi:hypothetical protein